MAEYPIGSDPIVRAGGFQEWFTNPDSGWQPLTLENGWTGTPVYRRVGKVVEIRGSVSGGTLNSNIATLPVGFRPSQQVNSMVPQLSTNGSDPNNSRILAQSSGAVNVSLLTNPHLHIRFFADDVDNQVATRTTPLYTDDSEVAPAAGFHTRFDFLEDTGWIDATPLLINGWLGINIPYYRRRGKTVSIRGRLTGGDLSQGGNLFVLPTGFRPSNLVRTVVRNSSSTGTGTGAGGLEVSNLGNVRAMAGATSNLTNPNLDISFFID